MTDKKSPSSFKIRVVSPSPKQQQNQQQQNQQHKKELTCSYHFFGERCPNVLTQVHTVHGGDRFCEEHLKFYKSDVDKEILCDCETTGCPLKVCKKLRSSVAQRRIPGDNRFCKQCLQKPEVRQMVAETPNFIPVFDSEDEYLTDSTNDDDDDDSDNDTKHSDQHCQDDDDFQQYAAAAAAAADDDETHCDENSNDEHEKQQQQQRQQSQGAISRIAASLPQRIAAAEQKQEQESSTMAATPTTPSFLTQQKYGKEQISIVVREATGSRDVKKAKSHALSGLVSDHVRCLIEVFIQKPKLSEELAKVLSWIVTATTGLPKAREWNSPALVLADDKKLRSELFLHKKWVIAELIRYLERTVGGIGNNKRGINKILDSLRKEKQEDITQATLDLFGTYIRKRHAQQPSPIKQFIDECIVFSSGSSRDSHEQAKPLTTTAIFKAYNAWAAANGTKLYKSNSAFGIALKEYEGKLWTIKEKSNQRFHYGISIRE